jgi:hemolysin D
MKVESFPFTRYGLIKGKILRVSADAIQDEQRGLVYEARISMAETTIPEDSRRVPLTPGMAVAAEVKTGARRAVTFFLSPLLRYVDESLRER